MNKNQVKPALVLGILVLSMMSVMAGNGSGNFEDKTFSRMGEVEMNSIRETFQYRYNFTGEGNWSYMEGENNSYKFENKNQKRFLFWDVETIEEYEIDGEGNVIQEKQNIWSRILNRNKSLEMIVDGN